MRCKASSESIEAIQSFFQSNSIIQASAEAINSRHHSVQNELQKDHQNVTNFSLIGRDVWQEEIMKFINPMELMIMRRVSREFNFWIESLDEELFWKKSQMKNLRRMVKGMLDSVSEKYFLNYMQKLIIKDHHHHDHNEINGFSYRKFILNICKDLQMERRASVNYRIYLNKEFVDEKHLKIPQKDELIENARPAIIIEGNLSATNGLLCAYHDGVFPYEYIPTIFSNTDIANVIIKSESSQAKITFSNLPVMCFDSASAHLSYYNNAIYIISFNKLSRLSWNEVSQSIIPSLSRKTGCIYILIGLNWGALAHNASIDSLKYTCDSSNSDEMVPNSEIFEYINGRKFMAYIDLKPKSEKEIFTFMDSILKLVIMKDKGFNLFEKDFISKVDEIYR